jgi:hypothetical protein
MLDDKPVQAISAFLLPGHVNSTPQALSCTPYFSQGCNICGQGFLFDDDDSEANPDSIRKNLIAANPEYSSRVLPYIGGEDVNGSPTLSAPRYVICLSDLKSEEELGAFPELAEIVRRKVKPIRDLLGNNPNNIPLKKKWWAFQAHRPELYSRIRTRQQVLVNSRVSGNLAFAFLPTSHIFSVRLNVFELSQYSAFSVMQSRIHELWARFLSSTFKDDLMYAPSDCFETFPFPVAYESNAMLDQVGNAYYDFRAAVMVRNHEGLTKTYNRFHDPNEDSPEIVRLRELHAAMDRAVLDAYGWQDIQPVCEFIPEFDDEEDEDENDRPKKKKYRYKWPEAIHDEVLARLLELNRQRALEEGQILVPEHTADNPWSNESQKSTKKRSRKSEDAGSPGTLFGAAEDEE